MTPLGLLLLCASVAWARGTEAPLDCSQARDSLSREDLLDESAEESEERVSPAELLRLSQEISEPELLCLGVLPEEPESSTKFFQGDLKGIDVWDLRKKSAIRSWRSRWPKGEVPFTLSSRYGKAGRAVIGRAMEQFHQLTCIKFVEYKGADVHPNYVHILADDGCYSYIGRVWLSGEEQGRQKLSLASGCLSTGTVVHELLHVVGFFHEHTRRDRDEFIQVVEENVIPGGLDQFEIMSSDTQGLPYDYSSVLHYGPTAFTKAYGLKTIRTLKPGGEKIGQRRGFSETDKLRVNKLYNCPAKDASKTTQATKATTTRRPRIVVHHKVKPVVRPVTVKPAPKPVTLRPAVTKPKTGSGKTCGPYRCCHGGGDHRICSALNVRKTNCNGRRSGHFFRMICPSLCGKCEDCSCG